MKNFLRKYFNSPEELREYCKCVEAAKLGDEVEFTFCGELKRYYATIVAIEELDTSMINIPKHRLIVGTRNQNEVGPDRFYWDTQNLLLCCTLSKTKLEINNFVGFRVLHFPYSRITRIFKKPK